MRPPTPAAPAENTVPADSKFRLLQTHPLRTLGPHFSVRSVELQGLAGRGLPVFTFDHFRVSGHHFGPHPHAGFSAVTYVLPESAGGLRSRDSLGHDIVVGPGGMVWIQAGRGALHEELPAVPGVELHGLQVFVNLPAALKLTPPQVLHLDGPAAPEWHGPDGDRVRVMVGQWGGLASPLQPLQPFRWLDVVLHSRLQIELPPGHHLLAYVVRGLARLQRGGVMQELTAGGAVTLAGNGAALNLQADAPTRLVLLSGPAIAEPMVGSGPFMMADAAQLRDAVRRYQAGEMGTLAPAA